MNHRLIDGLGVVIATMRRPDILAETIAALACRTTVPAHVLVIGTEAADLPPPIAAAPFPIYYLVSPRRGLTAQRNYGTSQLPATIRDVAYIDDDVEVHDDYCQEVSRVFADDPEVTAFSGCLLSNASNTSRTAARTLLDSYAIHPQLPGFERLASKWPGLYGCTMNIRRTLIERERFDENLPLYGLGEDVEIGFRLRRHGKVGGSGRCAIVHLAARSGRISEVGVGYAQIINFVYFARKRIGYSYRHCLFQRVAPVLLRNIASGFFGLRGRDDADYRGRLKGNLVALRHLLGGSVDPGRLVEVMATKKT